MRPRNDLAGRPFGRLTAIVCESRPTAYKRRIYWLCKCECGNQLWTRATSLIQGRTKSCGCYRKDILRNGTRPIVHGATRNAGREPLYNVWAGMKQRCHNPTQPGYKHYGKRGISVCRQWSRSFSVFKQWAERCGYRHGLQIDRIDNNGNYEPSNCRWVSQLNNARNQNKTIRFMAFGKEWTLREAAEVLRVNYMKIYYQFRNGIPPEEIMKRHGFAIVAQGEGRA